MNGYEARSHNGKTVITKLGQPIVKLENVETQDIFGRPTFTQTPVFDNDIAREILIAMQLLGAVKAISIPN